MKYIIYKTKETLSFNIYIVKLKVPATNNPPLNNSFIKNPTDKSPSKQTNTVNFVHPFDS